MILWIEKLNAVSEIWFDVVYQVVSQSILVFLIAMIVTTILQHYTESLRFCVWQATAVKLMIIPFSMIVVLPIWPPTYASRPDVAASLSIRRPVETHDPAPALASLPPIAPGLPTQRETIGVTTISCEFDSPTNYDP